jgi:hypothetical protein
MARLLGLKPSFQSTAGCHADYHAQMYPRAEGRVKKLAEKILFFRRLRAGATSAGSAVSFRLFAHHGLGEEVGLLGDAHGVLVGRLGS